MELTLKPHPQNTAPLSGILVLGGSAAHWLAEIQAMGVALSAVTAYAIPGADTTQNWGCLLTYPAGYPVGDVGRNSFCQCVGGLLYVPEKAALYPALSAAELDKLLVSRLHFWHPETGLIELARAIDWQDLLAEPVERAIIVKKPAEPVFVPTVVRSFQVRATPPEAVLERLEENLFPKQKPLDNKPLTSLEQAKRLLYRGLLGKPGAGKPSPVLNALDKLRALFTQKKDNWIETLQANQEDLESRNQAQLDKLLDLLKNNPGEALKYAIPLDEGGTARGSEQVGFTFALRWPDFSLFGKIDDSLSGSGISSVLADDSYQRLYDQYSQTAEELIRQKEHHKAAFVYMKLLKNYTLAAQTLETGKLYPEAASVWLKYLKNKPQAANCYEKANMTESAIELHKELGNHEKAGDLYTAINRPTEARIHYQRVIEDFTAQNKFVKAALFCRHKLNDTGTGQVLLLRGWRAGLDAYNCLNNYFAGIASPADVGEAIHEIYATDVTDINRESFLKAIKHEYGKYPALADDITDIAHEIISAQLPTNPAMAAELRFFSKADGQLSKDIIRFRNASRKIG
jgi:tetratricopeptide (TPR) repeat protein